MWSLQYAGAFRFSRTLKERAIHGQIVKALEDVSNVAGQLVEDHNAHRRPKKLEFKTPV